MTTPTATAAPKHDHAHHAAAPRYVETSDDLYLATYDRGDLGAPPVVLLHGAGTSSEEDWFATGRVAALLRAGYRIVAMDGRGHGCSDDGPAVDDASMEQLVADVEVVLDAYLLDDVLITGVGQGAAVARAVAERHAHRVIAALPLAELAPNGCLA